MKTDGGDMASCGRNDCTVKLRISGADVRSWCETNVFNNLETGALDSLNTTHSMGSCFNKVFSGDLFSILVTHEENDGWTGEWIELLFKDGSNAHCPLGIFLDDSSSATISCFMEIGNISRSDL
jgi:hypothetical protein